jgi:multiple sugar transport system substrate-binding protein
MFGKLSRRDMLKITALSAAGAALAGCQPGGTPRIEEQPTQAAPKKAEGKVVVMHFRHEFTEDQMNAFMAENPGITLEFVDGTDLTRFYAMYAAGTPPDLVRVQAPSIPQFLARKLLFDLTPYFQSSTVLKLDDLMPANDYYKAESPLKVGTGKIYGMVKDFSPDLTLFAYKPAFEEAGITLDDTKSYSYAEVAEMAKKVMKFEGDRILFFGFGNESGWIDRYWMVSLAELGQSLYSEGYEKIILSENEETRKILKFYFDLAKDKINYSPINPSPGGWMGTDFTAGQLGFIQYGFWFSAMAESDNTRGKVMMLPAPNWSGKRKDPTITATGMIMTAATQVPDAAWKTFEYYNGGQPALDRAKSGWGVPGLKSMLNLIPQETEFQKQANKVLQGELALNDTPLQFNPFLGETQVPNAFNKYLEIALKGDITFDEMLKSIEDEVNAAIKDGISAIMG